MDVDSLISPKSEAQSCEYCPFDVICLGCGFCVLKPMGKLLSDGPKLTVAA